jgi:hypothetical protein
MLEESSFMAKRHFAAGARTRPLVGYQWAFASVSLVALSFTGCNSGPTYVNPEGLLLVDGTPTGGVQVIFHPANPEINPASGVSNPDGTYRLTTGTNNGISPGDYTVTAVYPDPSVVPTPQEKMMGTDEPGPDLFKGKYVSASTSPMKMTVSASDQGLTPLDFSTKE